MSNAWLAEFDRMAVEAFADEGMAEADASYRATPDDDWIPCMVMIDRTVQYSDGAGGVVLSGNQVQVTAFRADIADQPPIGAQFVVGAETFTVGDVPAADESRWTCTCHP